jgi:hypothetical protein
MSHCKNYVAAQYINTGGQDLRKRPMTARFRPIHSSFETLRHTGRRVGHGFGVAAPANEQLTATGFARIIRPVQLYSDFIQR